MSDADRISEAMPTDPCDSIRAEVERGNAGQLARAELKNHAAQVGINLPDGFTDYLDASKLLGGRLQPLPGTALTNQTNPGHKRPGLLRCFDYTTGQASSALARFGEQVTTARDRYEGRSR